MPNNSKSTKKVKEANTSKRTSQKTEAVSSEKSKQVFKPRLLTLCCKERKVDKNDQWYYIPTVTLSGQWLYDAGFRCGQRIELIIENRQIMMQVESEPCDYPSKEQLTLQIKRLEKQLRQLPDETEIKQPLRTHKMKKNSSHHTAVFAE